MKIISTEDIELASPEERMDIVEQIQAIKKEPHTGPVLTIHPKVRIDGNSEQYKTVCFLNKVAIQSIFSPEAEKYELDFGNRTWINMNWNKELREYTADRVRRITFKVAAGKPQPGKSMARLKVSPKTGLIKCDWLATIIFQLDKTIKAMDQNTQYHFLLMPCELNSRDMEKGIKTGWEMSLLKEEPTEELLLSTEVEED